MSKITEGEMSFLEHLEVMRWHLLRSIAAVVILALVAFVFKDIVFDKIILAPKEPSFPTSRWLCQLGDLLGYDFKDLFHVFCVFYHFLSPSL